jgi:hypothetical protein
VPLPVAQRARGRSVPRADPSVPRELRARSRFDACRARSSQAMATGEAEIALQQLTAGAGASVVVRDRLGKNSDSARQRPDTPWPRLIIEQVKYIIWWARNIPWVKPGDPAVASS